MRLTILLIISIAIKVAQNMLVNENTNKNIIRKRAVNQFLTADEFLKTIMSQLRL